MTNKYHLAWAIIEKYHIALQQIANLANVTQSRGVFEQMFTPDGLIDDDGFGPIHPKLKQGLEYAARIARKALEEE